MSALSCARALGDLLRVLLVGAKARCQLCEGAGEVSLREHLLDHARDEARLAAKRVRRQVWQRLELRAEAFQLAEVGHGGREYGLAALVLDQRRHVPDVDLRGKAALVVGQQLAALDDGAVGRLKTTLTPSFSKNVSHSTP